MIISIFKKAVKALGRGMFRFDALATLLFISLYLGSAAALSGCMGGSDGVENPKMMELNFRPDDNSSSVSGRVSLYGKSLNPVADSTPILVKSFTSQAPVTFMPEEIDAAIKTQMLRTGKDTSAFKDTILDFNVLAIAGDKEVFLGGFKYRKLGLQAGFARTQGTKQSAFGTIQDSYKMATAVQNFSGRLGLQGFALNISYVFIPGSPYHSKIERDSTFTIPHMSKGTYGIVGADQDSAKFFESTDTLSTDDGSYSAKAWGPPIFFVPGQ
jgi:hypothetical protein